MSEPLTLQQIRRQHNLMSGELAELAGVPLRVEYMAEIGIKINRDDAAKLLAALSRRTNYPYTLENVAIKLHQSTPHPKPAVAASYFPAIPMPVTPPPTSPNSSGIHIRLQQKEKTI